MSESTEAPVSATVKVKSPNGFEWLFTMRSDTVSEQTTKIKTMEEEWLKASWTPLAQNFSKFPPKKEPKFIEGKKCPLDGGRLIEPEPGTRRPIKCENNKWNFQLKRAEGCTFTEWPNSYEDVPVRQVESFDEGWTHEKPKNDALPGAMYEETIQ